MKITLRDSMYILKHIQHNLPFGLWVFNMNTFKKEIVSFKKGTTFNEIMETLINKFGDKSSHIKVSMVF